MKVSSIEISSTGVWRRVGTWEPTAKECYEEQETMSPRMMSAWRWVHSPAHLAS